MEATEQLDDCFDLNLNFILTELLEAFDEFVVHIECNVLWSFVELIHEVLESNISSFLEPHIILECIWDHVIDFFLKFQKFQGKFYWVLLVFFVFNDFPALFHDEWVHFSNHVFQSGVDFEENCIHQAQLVNLSTFKHVSAAHFHVGNIFSLVLHTLR